MTRKTDANPKPKPLKRPRQARSVFTVTALYDAFVRIWKRDGWDSISTREIAAESGFAVGTIYEYFPNRTAILSGYVRHCVEHILSSLQSEIEDTQDLAWPQRVDRLVDITLGSDPDAGPYFDRDMLLREDEIAEIKHHARVLDELCRAWQSCLAQIPDLPQRPDAETLRALVQIMWGTRRYATLTDGSAHNASKTAHTLRRMTRHAISAIETETGRPKRVK